MKRFLESVALAIAITIGYVAALGTITQALF